MSSSQRVPRASRQILGLIEATERRLGTAPRFGRAHSVAHEVGDLALQVIA